MIISLIVLYILGFFVDIIDTKNRNDETHIWLMLLMAVLWPITLVTRILCKFWDWTYITE